MTDTEVLDVSAVDIDPPPETSTSMALAPRERRSEVIRPLDPDQLVESFKAYQDLLPRLLVESDYQAAEAGKKFVKKSGWRKIATAFDLDVQIIGEEVERDPATARILRAKTTARATAPSGRVMDGDGYCSADEFTGRRANNPKLENDLRGTAATRAKNRAISDLVGMGEVSAEEVSASAQAGPTFGDPITPEVAPRVLAALNLLLAPNLPGLDEPDVHAMWETLAKDADGYFPRVVGRALLFVAAALKARLEFVPESDVPADFDAGDEDGATQ